MTTWHSLGLVLGLPLISMTVFASCGGISDEDGSATSGGSGGSSSGSGGAGSGGQAQGGAAQGGGATCAELASGYASFLDEAKRCSPELSVEQCTHKVPTGLPCGCPDYANPKNAAALASLDNIQTKYQDMQCGAGIVCGPCPEPTRAYCSPAGRCESASAPTTGRSCKVNGVVYPDGAEGIADPTSCNKCGCIDGNLACTEIFCPVPCPDGTSPGRQCAECGPTDDCNVMEHGCFPTCMDTCAGGGKSCVNGACVSLCG